MNRAVTAALAALLLAGCGSGPPSEDRATFERHFVENCQKDGTPSDRCLCVYNYFDALASDAGKAPQDFSPSDADTAAADRQCR